MHIKYKAIQSKRTTFFGPRMRRLDEGRHLSDADFAAFSFSKLDVWLF